VGFFFFEGGFSGFALSFVSETQLRVRRGWNGMTRAYLGNHISPQGWRGRSSSSERRKFTGDIYKCSLCVGKEMEKCILKNSLQGLQWGGRVKAVVQLKYFLRIASNWNFPSGQLKDLYCSDNWNCNTIKCMLIAH